MPPEWPSARVGGARFGAVTEARAAEEIVAGAAAGRGLWALTANLDHMRRYRVDPEARALIDEADLVVADGAPLVWASRLAGTPLPERVTGSNLVWSVSELAAASGQSIFLLGGKPGYAARAGAIVAERYPGLEVAGTSCPPLGFERDREQMERLRAELREARPGIVFLGLGFPKQGLLIRELRGELPAASFIGVGGSFDFVTGETARAPGWVGRLGLEWVVRLAQEPRRLARRYLVEGIPFALRLLAGAAGERALRANVNR